MCLFDKVGSLTPYILFKIKWWQRSQCFTSKLSVHGSLGTQCDLRHRSLFEVSMIYNNVYRQPQGATLPCWVLHMVDTTTPSYYCRAMPVEAMDISLLSSSSLSSSFSSNGPTKDSLAVVVFVVQTHPSSPDPGHCPWLELRLGRRH